MIKYRKATATDFQLAFDIKSVSIKPYIEEIWGWDDEIQLKYHQADFDPENIRFILDKNNKELGLLDVLENDRSIFIKSILIIKSAQRCGIGREVMTDIIKQSELSSKPVEIQVFKINVGAKSFYEKLDFITIGQTEFHYQMIRRV